ESIEAETNITVGGRKYGEFEIETTSSIRDLVYVEGTPLKSEPQEGEYPRGQRTPAVNRQALPSQVRLLPPPLSPTDSPPPAALAPRFQPSKYERKLGKSGQE